MSMLWGHGGQSKRERVNNLVKFRNFKKCFRIPKDDVSVHPSVKLNLLMSSQRGYLIIHLRPFLRRDVIIAIFAIFHYDIHVFYRVLGVMGQNRKYDILY